MSAKLIFLPTLCAALAAGSLSAGVHEFSPSDRIEMRSEPKGFEHLVSVSQTADRVTFDCRAAFAKGMRNLVCLLPQFEDSRLAGADILAEVFVSSADAQTFVQPYLQMWKEIGGERKFRVMRSRSPFMVAGDRESVTRCVFVDTCPERSGGYILRFDLRKPQYGTGGVFSFVRGCVARFDEVMADARPKVVRPELTMYLPFDGSAEASFAKGAATPLSESGTAYVPGMRGRALRVSTKDRTVLEYAFAGNVSQERGAVSMWVKRNTSVAERSGWLLSSPTPFNLRLGTGALYLWLWGDSGARLRLDTSDDCDAYVWRSVVQDGEWHHVVASWNEAGGSLFVDGAQCYDDVGGSSLQPLEKARQPYSFSNLGKWDAARRFFIGSRGGADQFDGLIDEVKIFSAALTKEQAQELYREGGLPPRSRPDYAAMSERRGRNVYESAPVGKGGNLGEMELVREVCFDADGLASLRKPGTKFEVVGASSLRSTADGAPYLELGGKELSRMAVGFDLKPDEPLYAFEIDYPDDAKRTMDLIVQDAFSPFYETFRMQDYEMQVGVYTGGDLPLSGKVRTHRCVYWASSTNAVLVAMTAREGEPAAVSAIRLYRLKGRALPSAKVSSPERRPGWGRTIGWYYEDPSIDREFAVPGYARAPEQWMDMVDRIAATMKYQGLNLFAYPAAWYNGMMDDLYNPHGHPQDFMKAFYERFDREGLGVVPLINQESHPVPPGSLTYDMIVSGDVHGTMYSVTATGRPQYGITYAPSLFNVCHPDTQRYLEGMIDRLVADGAKHPSFRGVGLHVKHSSICWLGMITSGYNDYMVDGFTKDTGIKVPVDRSDPMRGKAYAKWLMENAYEPWVQWRCRKVSGFWVKIARKLAAVRPDLKLWINNIANLDPLMDRFTSPDYMRRMAREGGLDREIFAKEAPNVVMGQTSLPADCRFAKPGWYYSTKADYECQRDYHTRPYYWDFLEGASFPLVHMHDRYWECAAGDRARNHNPDLHFKAKWFREVKWRVSTLNAGGPYSMEHYAVPLRFRDVLGFTKGGYLVGTYGMEPYLVPFAQAFRALPAVGMETMPGGGEYVRLRFVRHEGRSWSYLVNTGVNPVRVSVQFPPGTHDLVSGEALAGKAEIALGPYELRSFGSAAGTPAIVTVKPE